jgi:DNA repair exonuclease SbcCD ATPase subunit
MAEEEKKVKKSEEKESELSEEEDDHFKLYGKRAWEVEYGEKCPVCGKRIDEFGFCACGSAG